MSLESVINDLDETVESLDDAVRSQGTEVGRLADSVTSLAELLRDQATKDALAKGTTLPPGVVNISNAFRTSLDAQGYSGEQDTYSGFNEGDKVVYIASFHPQGLHATVKFHDDRPFKDGEVPVVRGDTNKNDVFPARATILAANLRHFVPAPDEFWRGQPEGGQFDWNMRMFEAALEHNLKVEFLYERPTGRRDPTWMQPQRESKTITVSRINKMGPSDLDTIVVGYDLTKNEPRNFRLDRIKSYVTYVGRKETP